MIGSNVVQSSQLFVSALALVEVSTAPARTPMAREPEAKVLVNSQVLAKPLICLGDGHDGIWNLFREIGEKQERIEILDWYHLIENLYKVGGSFQRIEEVKSFLWMGKVDAAISCFEGWSEPQVENFITYLNKHKHRIVNYGYFQEEGISIGSGSGSSQVKQIGFRVKIAGASWNSGNVPQVLRHRCAYLNGSLF